MLALRPACVCGCWLAGWLADWLVCWLAGRVSVFIVDCFLGCWCARCMVACGVWRVADRYVNFLKQLRFRISAPFQDAMDAVSDNSRQLAPFS